jgi:hypothetical protein
MKVILMKIYKYESENNPSPAKVFPPEFLMNKLNILIHDKLG